MKHQGIISIILVAILFVTGWLGLMPQTQKFFDFNSGKNSLEKAVEAAQDLSKTVNTSATRYDAEYSRASDYLKSVPETISQANLISQIQSMAALTGVVVDSMKIDTDRDKRRAAVGSSSVSGVVAAPISLSITGTYAQLKAFLKTTENNLPIMTGQTLAFKTFGDSNEGQRGFYQLDVSFETFGLK